MRLDDLGDIDWRSFVGPTEGPMQYVPEKVPRSLQALAEAGSEPQMWSACTKVLYAIGNDHAGTLWPEAAAIVPFLLTISQSANSAWARRGAVECLTDMICSFDPALGYEDVAKEDGTRVRLIDELLAEMRKGEVLFREMLTDATTSPALRTTLADLLDCLEDPRALEEKGQPVR